MNAKPKALVAWSSGKDSAWALHVTRQAGDVDITGLLTTVTGEYDRVSMHAVRNALLDRQAEAVGLPLRRVVIPAKCTNEIYAERMRESMEAAKASGITHVIFGDLFLEDIRDYRVRNLSAVGMEAVFPLWKRDTAALAREMIAAGVRACITCIDPRKMPRDLAGHAFDEELLARLPAGVDPCAENGEFHTVVWDGPMFARPVGVRIGETVERDGFVFTDVIPA